MKNFLSFLFVFLLVACNRSNDAIPYVGTPPPVNPLENGDMITAAQGTFYDGVCSENGYLGSQISSMTFRFSEPLSWKDSFFEQNSLEFTGRLEVTKHEFDNAYCLGRGNEISKLSSNVLGDNISVIKDSVTPNGFKAFYAQEITKATSPDQLDRGRGLLVEFKRVNRAFEIQVMRSFEYVGKDFSLYDLSGQSSESAFTFSSLEIPGKYQDMSMLDGDYDELKILFKRSSCHAPYRIFEGSTDSGGFVVIVLRPQPSGLAMQMMYKNEWGSKTRFSTTNLDWTFRGTRVYTEKGFVFSVNADDKLIVDNPRYGIGWNFVESKSWTVNSLENFLELHYNMTNDVFKNCN